MHNGAAGVVGPDGNVARPDGQRRSRSLAATLDLARRAVTGAGVTRLADVTGLDRLGIPVFQAIRPLARSLSVSQGKGLTPLAAMVSALLEATEFALAEALPPPLDPTPLAALDAATIALWSAAPRPATAIRLDPAFARGWLPAHVVRDGTAVLMPWDQVSLDFTRPASPDGVTTSVGMAAGNSLTEATCGAVAELVEHAIEAEWGDAAPLAKRASEVDLASIDSPLVRGLLARIVAGGCTPRLWSMGQESAIAVFRCVIVEADGADTALVPATGSGAHPDRTIAALRAILEAAQARVTYIAGARDDLAVSDYRQRSERTFELVFSTLSFGAGPLAWSAVPHHPTAAIADDLDVLLGVVAAKTPLPVVALELESPVPGLSFVRALAPGLGDPDRAGRPAIVVSARPPAIRTRVVERPAVVFAGPSLPAGSLPAGVERRGPAVAGDLAALLADPPRAVGLIDGSFEIAPTVWHKEILDLIAHGVPVFGAASLGAIRAAELHTLGMIGVGHVFAAYRDGLIRRDDAVMVRHAPVELGYRALTLALVDAEVALRLANLPEAERRMLQRIVRTTPFRRRDWPACLAAFARRTGHPATAGADELSAMPSVKHADARLLVAALATAAAIPPGPRPPISCFYRRLLNGLSATTP